VTGAGEPDTAWVTPAPADDAALVTGAVADDAALVTGAVADDAALVTGAVADELGAEDAGPEGVGTGAVADELVLVPDEVRADVVVATTREVAGEAAAVALDMSAGLSADARAADTMLAPTARMLATMAMRSLTRADPIGVIVPCCVGA
jgi:hypothetical protein